MENDTSRLVNLWKQEISKHIKEYVPYQATQQLEQIAAFFSPGLFYYYIFNFQNLQMEYVHPGTQKLLGIPPGDYSVYRLLEMLNPGEISKMKEKEALVVEFYYEFLSPADIPNYKTVYYLKVCDRLGNYRTILHQMTPLSQNGAGKVIHILAVHTEVSHLSLSSQDFVSFISLKGEKSYFNVDPGKGIYRHIKEGKRGEALADVLSNRELDVIREMARGLNAEKIADKLHVAFNTIRTHRKNILEKTGCVNSTELVARCIVEGVI